MNHLATRDVLGVGESGDLSMFLLHRENFAHPSLTICDAVLHLCKVLSVLSLEALVLQAVPLAAQYITHVGILRERPICEVELESANQIFCLEVLNIVSHVLLIYYFNQWSLLRRRRRV